MVRLTAALALIVVALGLAGCAGSDGSSDSADVRVERVIDGDTIRLTDGSRVRLVQIDTPEVDEGECYADEAAIALEQLAPPGTRVELRVDAALDDRDRFGRLLRYVFVDGVNVNLRLVQDGAASVWFYHGDRGRYADELLNAANVAQARGRGLWGACPAATLNPTRSVETG